MIARGVEAACWMAGRDHDYPEQFAAGLKPHAVQEKYYYARRPEITRVVDISGRRGSRRSRPTAPTRPKGRPAITDRGSARSWPRRTSGCRCWATTTPTADRNYIKEFVLARDRELGRKYGVEYAEAFHYIGPGTARTPAADYIRKNAVTLEKSR